MKLRTPLSIIRNALGDINEMHDFNYIAPSQTRDEFWEEECDLFPTKSTCKTYEV